MNPPILPWKATQTGPIHPLYPNTPPYNVPSAQHAETVRLLEDAEPWVSRCETKLATQIRAHLAKLRGEKGTP